MAKFILYLRKSWANLERVPRFLFVAWLLVFLSLPVLRLVFGEQALLQGMSLAVLLQVALILNQLYREWGWWSVLRTAIGVVLLVWSVQAIIIRSGLPYGTLYYTSLLQPQVLGIPVLIPLTWLMMLPPAWAIAKMITHQVSGCVMRLIFIGLSAAAFTSWTIYFDPMMARLGLLKWIPEGTFYGVPWQNYFFWFFISGLITLAISPKRMSAGILVLVYAINWSVGLIFLLMIGGLIVPALIGFLLMGGLILSAALLIQ